MTGEKLTATTQTTNYCPWKHAEALGIAIKHRQLPAPMVAAYSPDSDLIYVRPGLRFIVEKCAIAHEIVHWEYRDTGERPGEEQRANKIASQRLIDSEELTKLLADSLDYRHIARELGVTLTILKAYLAE